jgi:pyruvate formate lyase activating enzyme
MKSVNTLKSTGWIMLPREPVDRLRIGGVQPFTTLDFPGQHAAVIFLQGCPLACVYCHNRDLLPMRTPGRIAWPEVRDMLSRRRGLLDAVVFSGGEPLGQAALTDAIREVKAMGFKIGLHTSGVSPKRLQRVLSDVDWVGLDIKAPFDDYGPVTGRVRAGEQVRQSYQLLRRGNVAHEVRTTVWPDHLGEAEVTAIAASLDPETTSAFILQEARHPANDRPCGGDVFSNSDLLARLRDRFSAFHIRRAAS